MHRAACRRLAAAAAVLGVAACDSAGPPGGVASEPLEPQLVETLEGAVQLEPAQRAAAQALEEALFDPDPFARAGRLAALLSELGPEGLPAVKEALRHPRFQYSRGGGELELMARFWARHEPEAATRWAVEDSVPGYRLSAVFATLSPWAALDPQSAAASLNWSVNDEARELMQVALVHGWFQKDPVGLGRHIARLEMGYVRQRKLSHYVRLLVERQGPEAAKRWAEALSDDDEVFKRAAYREVGAALPAFDAGAAVQWCETHCEGPYGRDIAAATALRWSRLDGRAAIEWLGSLPASGEQEGAIRTTFGWWAQKELEEVAAWMAHQWSSGEPEPWVRPLVPSFALVLAQESPVEAIGWAERVEDGDEREHLMIQVAQRWRARDEAAAEAWLDQSPLSETARNKARIRPPGRPFRGF